ncbi:hypothetical protein [Idiomarina sp. HP20-50]|uniref:hypothetical protein n=1 Tax=Idiomarina sp. HP20-50 TaxID=3070813 RepID=UPI00294B10F7|nr:hypothetical protein [Idiomarina sp. HP20-50]MDV6315319.1 hypothetical protein [Idiomarina sp. HP20-50]
MNKILILVLSLFLSGCTSSDMLYYLTHPKDSSNKPSTAAIYTGAALIMGEIKEECSYGHPEDQIKCRKEKEARERKD